MTSANDALLVSRAGPLSLHGCPVSPEHLLISLVARTSEQNGSRENVGDEETGAIDDIGGARQVADVRKTKPLSSSALDKISSSF